MSSGDSGHTKWSDYELLAALDTALHLLELECDEYFSPLLVKTKELELTDDEVLVPEDFRSIITLQDGDGRKLVSNYEDGPGAGEYRFENNKLISPESPVTLTYRYTLPDLRGINDTIDLPGSLDTALARMTSLILSGSIDAAEAQAVKTAQSAKRQRWENGREPELWGGYVPC